MVRRLCSEAMSDSMAVEDEVVFATGDACDQMTFIRSGRFLYTADAESMKERSQQALGRKSPVPENLFTELVRGSTLCQAALWTQWECRGGLAAVEDSLP